MDSFIHSFRPFL